MKGFCQSNYHYPSLWLPGRACRHELTAPPPLPASRAPDGRAQALPFSGARPACWGLDGKEGGRAAVLRGSIAATLRPPLSQAPVPGLTREDWATHAQCLEPRTPVGRGQESG